MKAEHAKLLELRVVRVAVSVAVGVVAVVVAACSR